jgi:hypothetical protein
MYREEEYLDRLAEHEAFKSLCRSLVVRALRDYVTYKNARKTGERRLYAEATEWIFDGHAVDVPASTDPIHLGCCNDAQTELHLELLELDQLMSFDSICAILGWDADMVRRRAKVLTQADLDRIGPNLMDL